MLSDARNANRVTKTPTKTPVVPSRLGTDCRKNWTGSSKSMEPDMAVNMLHNLKDKGFHVKNLVLDNDANTISKARSNFDPNIQEFSDF